MNFSLGRFRVHDLVLARYLVLVTFLVRDLLLLILLKLIGKVTFQSTNLTIFGCVLATFLRVCLEVLDLIFDACVEDLSLGNEIVELCGFGIVGAVEYSLV